VPLAVFVGYLLTDPFQKQSIAFEAVVLAVLVFPLLMKWHYPLLILSWGLPATLFFLPGRPSLFLAMVAASLTISTVERILDRSKPHLPVPAVRWPLLAFLVVIFITAKLTGGFGLRSMGGDVYGGKKYIFLIVGILSFFAITARPISRKDVNLYVLLYFAGGFFTVIQDFYSYIPSPLHFIYWIIPPSSTGMSEFGGQTVVFGQTRLGGVAGAATAVFYWRLARYGFRDNFVTGKVWRPLIVGSMFILIFLGGFRSAILGALMTMTVIFLLEKMHRTGVMLVLLMGGILGGALLVPLASHLPFTFQRALAFLPLDISPEARIDAEGSTQWRLDMWEALWPQVPKYLMLGKGYAFSAETFNENIALDSALSHSIDAAENPLALAGDYHSGPLSVVLSMGIWGVLVWLWFWIAGFFVLWRNYRYGDPELRHINIFLYASFLTKCITFLFIAGNMADDVGGFTGVIGLSVAMNHGVKRRPAPLPANQNRPALPRLAERQAAFAPRPALPAVGR